ncbi:MAG: TetR/AcrR family transcriptional regulator, partial [Anaerolineales bacterium]|nr:TetR/AcrR family transcriptional regulator [Anaerolineales bacterium]
QLVLEKGYDAISIQDITERADLGRGTFYLHFKDKEEVVWTAFKDLFQELEQEAHKQLDRHMPQVEFYGLLNIFRHAQKNRDLYRLMFGGQGSAMLTARVQDFLAKVFLDDIRNAPEPPEINFNIPEEIEAQLLTGVISRLLLWWLETPNKYTPEQMAAMTYNALYRKPPPTLDA